MKSFLLSHKNKKAGISLLLAMVGSTMAISIVVAILVIVTRSVEQSQELERSTQVFFAIESGLEAGFFHHNARGQGVSFLDLNDASFPAEQKILHTATNIETDWTIDGRAENATLEGLIAENKPLQIRWFWDNASKVSDLIDSVSYTPDFLLTFNNTNLIPLNFDFGKVEDGVLISWMFTRKTDAEGVSSLIPKANDPEDPCGGGSSFICRDQLATATLSDGDLSMNTLLPRTLTEIEKSINTFLAEIAGDFQLVLTPTREFRNSSDNTKIEGIPFTLIEENGVALPRPDYSIRTSVSTGKFLKNINLENIPEQTSVHAFSYVIFD